LSDVNANIGIVFDAKDALASLRQLQAGLSRFNQALTAGNINAANAQKGLNDQLVQAINSTGKFVASQKSVATSTSAFTSALEKNKLSMGEYFRYTAAAATANTKTLKGAFTAERDIINRARRDRVKALQTQYVQLTNANGELVKVLQVVPKHLEMVNGKYADYATRTQMAAQRQQFLNQMLKQGSTQLLNFGKNTQWAGRQLMVGLTIPLTMLGSFAAKTFKEMEEAVIKFSRVYGDMTTTGDATNKAVADIKKLGMEFTKYGVAVKDTMEMAASAAAMGLTGNDLQQQVISATKLAVLGQVEQAQALETTISLQNAFGISAEDLAKKINFLNAVENQTVLSIEDLTVAIPKAGPVVEQLGGSVEDLAFFMTAMKEGGINASEGANALKSGLASMINPGKKTVEMLSNLGININGIVQGNAGDLKGTVVGFARALDTLDPLNRAKAIEQLFGKFQFARLSTLFQNITKDGSQASRALGLAGASVEELAILSERELGKVEDAVGVKFQKTIEDLKVSLVPVGKAFLEALTPVVAFLGKIVDKFNNFSDGTKKAIAVVVGVVGGLAPVALMTFGLLANGLANIIKFFALLRSGMAKLNGQNAVLGGGFDYLTQQEIENITETNALHMSHKTLIETFNVEASSVNLLANAYANAASQARTLAASSPGLFNAVPGAKGATSGLKFANGGVVPGTGNKDNVPAMLMPGEVVLTKQMVKENPELVAALQNGNIRKYGTGTGDNARSGMSYRGTHNLIMGRSGFDNGPTQSAAQTPSSKLPAYLQKEYDRIENLTEANLRRYSELTGQGIGKSMDEIRKIVLADFENMLVEIKSKFGSVSKSGIEAVGKQWDAGKQSTRMGTWAPKFNEAYGDSFAHVGNAKNVSQSSSMQLDLKKEIIDSMKVVKDYYAETGRKAPDVRVADAFGFKAKQYINRGMASENQGNFQKKYGQSVGQAFEGDFAEQGAEKWRDMTEMVGKDFDKVKAQAEIYDKALLTKIQSWNTENANKQIPDPFTDDVFRELERSVSADVDSLIPDFKAVITTAKTKITALRTSIQQDDLAPINQRLKGQGLPIMGTEASNAKYGNVEARSAKELLGTKLPESVQKSLSEAEAIAETASPSKRTKRLGKNIGKGLEDGLAESLPAVQAQSAKLSEAAVPEQSSQTILKETEGTAERVISSNEILSDNNDNLISTTELNEAIVDDTDNIKRETLEASVNEQRLNDLRQQEILAKEQSVQNARSAAAQSDIPFTSQSDKVAGDIGFIGPLTKDQQRQQQVAEKAARKLKVKEARGMRREAVGRYSGKAAGALGTASMIAGVAGAPAQVTGALGAASMATSMAPALAGMGPVGMTIAAVAAVGVGLKLLDNKFRDAAVKQAEYVKSISATTEKMKEIGVITGKVGATELMAKRRENGQFQGYNEVQRKGSDFGQKFLEEETGKAIQSAFSSNMMKVGAKKAAESLSFELSQYISDGVMTAEDANSIAYQIGVNLNDSTLTTNIQGSLRMLVGPNGENLLKDPLNARMRIVSMADARSNRVLQEMYDAGKAGNSGVTEAAQLAAYSANTIQVAQAQADAISVYADKQTKVLETELAVTTNKQRQIEIQTEINNLVNMQVVANAKIAASIANAVSNFGKVASAGGPLSTSARREDAFFDASKSDVKSKYKGTQYESASQRVLNTTARADESNLGRQGGRAFEAKVQFIMASGAMNPSQIESMLKIFEGDLKSMDVALNVGIRKLGGARMGELTGLLSGVDKKIAKTITLGLIRKNPSDFDKTAKALALLQASDGFEVNMEAYIKTVGLAGLQLLTNKLDAIEKLNSPVTKEVVIQYGKDNSVNVDGLIANWDYYEKMDPEVRKEAIQTYTMITDAIMNFDSPEARAEWARKYAEQEALLSGEKGSAAYKTTYKLVYDVAVTGDAAKVADLLVTKKYGNTTSVASKDPKGDGSLGGGDKKNPLDFLDSLAMRIKNVRNGAFDATQPLKSMIAAFSGKEAQKDVSRMFTLFDGLQQRMLKMGVPKEFRDMIAGMSAEDFKAFASLPKGKNMFAYQEGKSKTKANITGLTKEGKAVMQTYREAQVGEFQVVQKEIIASVQEQDKAFKLLVGAGMSAADALLVVEDKAIAASVAAGAVGKKGSAEMKQFITDTKAANDALSIQAAFNKARTANAEFAIFKNAPELAKNMKAAGYSSEQIEAALSDPDIAKYLLQDLKDGAIAAGDMKDYIDSIAQRQSIDIKVGLASGDWGKVTDAGRQLVDEMFAAQEALIRTGSKGQEINRNNLKISDLEQQISPFQTKINEINQALAKNQRTIEETYTRPIEVLQTAVEGLDRQLETSPIFGNRLMEKIQEQNTMYSNDLAVISHESEKINTAYDKQLDALSETKEINDEIIAQQGRQLGLADALSQGDIAAAARAAQEMKAASASQFANTQTTAIQQARQNALNNLKGPQSGMTQAQIEEAQYQNSQKLYAIETNPARVAILTQIKTKQDEIYTLEQAKSTLLTKIRGQEDEIYKIQTDSILPLQNQIDSLVTRNTQLQSSIDKEVAAITVLGKNRDAWNEINAKIDLAKLASKSLDTAFTGLLDGAKAIDGIWANILLKLKAYADAPKDSPASTSTNTGNATAAQVAAKAAEDRSKILTSSVGNIQTMVKSGDINAAEKATTTMMKELASAAPSLPLTAQQVVSARKQALGYLSGGGLVPKYFASGGFAKGSDTVPAMLTPGEFVMSKYSVQTHGINTMKAINNGSAPMSDSVYNYNLSVNVKSDANPNEIAQAVMTQIRSIDSQRIRGSRI
jgi:TP901 family phage tail tape measure protein